MATDEQVKVIEALLQEEIRWTVEKGPGWNPAQGAAWDFQNSRWIAVCCGTCAIGALLLHRQPNVDSSCYDDVSAAAKVLGVETNWLTTVYYAVTETDYYERQMHIEASGAPLDAVLLGHRLRDFGDALVAKNARAG